MNESKLFKNATLVNEGKTFVSDVLVVGERIEKIASSISPKAHSKTTEINAEGLLLIPEVIAAHTCQRPAATLDTPPVKPETSTGVV